jgi:hypothetical protein
VTNRGGSPGGVAGSKLESGPQRRPLVAAFLVVLAFGVAACSGSGDAGRTAADDGTGGSTGAGRLYVQKATSASVVTDGTTSELVLAGVDPSTTWFADRPIRQAGSLETAAFVDGWSAAGFAATPPNAVVQLESGERTSSAVVLSDPRWDPDAGELRYSVRPDEGSSLPPERTGPVALFIDDGGAGPSPRTLTIAVSNLPNPSPEVGFDFRGLALDLNAVTVEDPTGGTIPMERLTMSESAISVELGSAEDGGVLEMTIQLTVVVPAGAQAFTVISSVPVQAGASAALSFEGDTAEIQLNPGPTEVALPE